MSSDRTELVKLAEKNGYKFVSQKKHIKMSNGETIILIPNHNKINNLTKIRIEKQIKS